MPRRLLADDPPRYYQNIRRSAETFLGIASSTLSRNEAWDFMDLGRQLERADKTTRFLDVANYLPGGAEGVEAVSPGILHWSAILRSCGALGAYRAFNRGINARGVVDFLMFSKDFPRSVRFCIEKADISLHRISGTPRGTFSNDAERETGRLLADLNFGSTDDAFASGLHDYLDALQERFNRIGKAIFETYVLMPERIQVCPVPRVPFTLRSGPMADATTAGATVIGSGAPATPAAECGFRCLHRTTFHYGAPVTHSLNTLHLEPRTFPYQKTLSSLIRVIPATRLRRFSDLFQNITHHFELPEPHWKLEIESRIRVHNLPLDISDASRAATVDGYRTPTIRERIWPYLQESSRVSKSPEVWRETIDVTRGIPSVYGQACAIMEWIHREFRYEPGRHRA